jgi:hypothetical protein
LRERGTELPYNDIEFFVFIRGQCLANEVRYRRKLTALGEHLSRKVGIEVEFKILSLKKLRRSTISMFYYDLLMGHRWIIGSESLFEGCQHHGESDKIPLHEVTRLIFNRSSGLLFSKERLQRAEFTPEDADFVGRNLAKVRLALGDAELASRGLYHWSCRERHRRLAKLPDVDESLLEHHAEGVAFKLHPKRSRLAREELIAEHASLTALAEDVFLKHESRRLGQHFGSAQNYAASPVNKCPEQSLWKNLLIHLKSPATAQRLARYPRESLLNQLALMLWCDAPVNAVSISGYARLWHRWN